MGLKMALEKTHNPWIRSLDPFRRTKNFRFEVNMTKSIFGTPLRGDTSKPYRSKKYKVKARIIKISKSEATSYLEGNYPKNSDSSKSSRPGKSDNSKDVV